MFISFYFIIIVAVVIIIISLAILIYFKKYILFTTAIPVERMEFHIGNNPTIFSVDLYFVSIL